jgi:hypothetical protein
MLAALAHALDLLFNRIARQGYAELGEWIDTGQHCAWAATGEQRQCANGCLVGTRRGTYEAL